MEKSRRQIRLEAEESALNLFSAVTKLPICVYDRGDDGNYYRRVFQANTDYDSPYCHSIQKMLGEPGSRGICTNDITDRILSFITKGESQN